MFGRLYNSRIIPVLLVAIIVALCMYLHFPRILFAQTPTVQQGSVEGEATLGVARLMDIIEKDVKDGSVVTSTQDGPHLSSRPYDPQVLGVVSRTAAIILNSGRSTANGLPVISTGQVYILVSSKEGPIKKGDLLTTSTIPGVAVKATKDGYVLGNALENYSSSDPKQISQIAMDLNLHYFNAKPTILGSLSDIFKIAMLPTKESPAPIFKYIVAALVVISSFILTFLTFGRTAAKGIEALGRNPAASGLIHLGIIFNISICVVITIVGLIVAFLILRL